MRKHGQRDDHDQRKVCTRAVRAAHRGPNGRQDDDQAKEKVARFDEVAHEGLAQGWRGRPEAGFRHMELEERLSWRSATQGNERHLEHEAQHHEDKDHANCAEPAPVAKKYRQPNQQGQVDDACGDAKAGGHAEFEVGWGEMCWRLKPLAALAL